MLVFQLYRVKLASSGQLDLYRTEPDRPAILRSALEDSIRLPGSFLWHTGDLEEIDSDGLYFRVGRIRAERVPVFDETTGSFSEQEFATAPYTHALLDLQFGVLGLAKHAALTPQTNAVTRSLAEILEATSSLQESALSLSIDPIHDPASFIAQLRGAHRIARFSIDFGRPNPFDADRDFQQPAERLLQNANGQTGKTTLKGESLDASTLEGLARSAGATGNDASARIRATPSAPLITKHLKESLAEVSVDEVDSGTGRTGAMDRIRSGYTRIRQPVE